MGLYIRPIRSAADLALFLCKIPKYFEKLVYHIHYIRYQLLQQHNQISLNDYRSSIRTKREGHF